MRSEVLQFVRFATFRRMFNAAKVWASYNVARISKRPVHWGKPIAVSIEPTTACNLGCPECPSGLKKFSRPTGNLKGDLNKKIIDQLLPELQYVTFYFQGEPFINPDFLEMVEYASSKKIYTATSTNAHFITDDVARKTVESGLNRLIISIDGVTQDVYQQYRVHGKLDKVIAGTKNILKWKKELNSNWPNVVFQFLVAKPNEHQIQGVIELGKELGVDDVWFKTVQVYDYENGNPLIPTQEKYSRYKKLASGKYVLKNKMINQCWRMWQSCVFTWDGGVVPCCFDKDGTHRFGDISDQNFSQIWKGEGYKNFRRAVLRGRDQIEICKNCSEGAKVWT